MIIMTPTLVMCKAMISLVSLFLCFFACMFLLVRDRAIPRAKMFWCHVYFLFAFHIILLIFFYSPPILTLFSTADGARFFLAVLGTIGGTLYYYDLCLTLRFNERYIKKRYWRIYAVLAVFFMVRACLMEFQNAFLVNPEAIEALEFLCKTIFYIPKIK